MGFSNLGSNNVDSRPNKIQVSLLGLTLARSKAYKLATAHVHYSIVRQFPAGKTSKPHSTDVMDYGFPWNLVCEFELCYWCLNDLCISVISSLELPIEAKKTLILFYVFHSRPCGTSTDGN